MVIVRRGGPGCRDQHVIIVRCVVTDDHGRPWSSVEDARWEAAADELLDRVVGRFIRVETCRWAPGFGRVARRPVA